MTYGAYSPGGIVSHRRERSRSPLSQAVLCAAALTLSAPAGLWILYGHPVAVPPTALVTQVVGTQVVVTQVAATQVVAPVAPVPKPAAPRYSAFIDPAFLSGGAPATFAQSRPVSARFEAARQSALALVAPAPAETAPVVVAEIAIVPPLPAVPALVRDIPLPMPRPAVLDAEEAIPVPVPLDRRVMQQALAQQAPLPTAARPQHRSFFDRMFHPAEPSGTALAYAAPEDGGLGLFGAARRFSPDHWTAIYDISAHTVTLPDGTRLEAHSGLGAAKDNPNSVTEHMRGATPPNVYELQPREGLFHGVAALRLNPVGGTTYGRGGLLAHTYMLGPHGDSNGCVVFKDYQAFRRAYDNGDIRRLVVVARAD